MKKNWFEGVTTMQALKIRYKELAKAYHPDLNPEAGDEAMQQINAQYDALAARLSKIAADGCTEATAQERKTAQDVAAAYRAVIVKIINLEGLNIELCGSWLWVSGDTRMHKDALKAAGLWWSAKKLMWYWRPEEAGARHNRRSHSMQYIRERYGSAKITAAGDAEHLALAY